MIPYTGRRERPYILKEKGLKRVPVYIAGLGDLWGNPACEAQMEQK